MEKKRPAGKRAKAAHPPAEGPVPKSGGERRVVERVQTGLRMEKRILKVLKALAELYDLSLGDLLEGIVLHAFEGQTPFGPDSLSRIADLKRVYQLDLDASDSHRLVEKEGGDAE